MTFPTLRMRRLRRTPALRRMVTETRLSVDNLVLPLFGPSSLRDTGGLVGDFAISREINVFGVRKAIWASIPLTVLEVIQIRDNLAFAYGDLSSPFEYEMVRLLYLKKREMEISR